MSDPGTESLLDTAILRSLLTESSLGFQVVDPDLRVVRFNPAAAGVRGAVGREAIGLRLRDLAPRLVDDAAEQMLYDVLDTGRTVIDAEVAGCPPSDPEHRHVYEVSLFRLQDPAGRVLGVLIASTDVTERHRAQARVDLLIEASRRIGSTLDVAATAGELAEVAVPELSDMATVDVLDDVLRGDAPPPGPMDPQTVLRRAASQPATATVARSVSTVGEATLPHSSSQTRHLAEMAPCLVPHLEVTTERPMDDPNREELIGQAAHSLMVVPLTARGVALGLASFYRTTTIDPFDEDDLALATELTGRAAVCIDNARRYTRERNAALILQRSLLPQVLPDLSAVQVAWRHLSQHAGGDWFDVMPLSGARVALVVGHVPGHGMHAAAVMGRLRTAVHTLAAQDKAPDELLAHLDDLVAGTFADQAPGDSPLMERAAGATCVYAVYDPISRRCTVARAGHPAPLIAYPDGRVDASEVPTGPPLGSGTPSYETLELELPEGTTIALYNEGLARADTGAPQREPARLRHALANPFRALDDTCETAIQAGESPRHDEDVVLLLAQTRALDPDQVATWTLPRDHAIVATSRTLASRQLSTWNVEELTFTTELIVSELVTNAIRYGSGPIHLRLIRDRALICEVSDGSSTAPHLRYAHASDEGGRGLFLIAQLADRWGTRYAARGKTIWAEQALG
ncbi:SpoIIE family protein phosphatase [Streptomyces sp. NPDC015661]|uniref:SpoIIE family protein phosphatase n=1 Tax=Streptomyces sp. NPDC015661 TaxID=3364961 RepID=UPI003700F56A